MKLPKVFVIAVAVGLANIADAQAPETLVGLRVETSAGVRLGTVNDVIVDGYGRATYVIVSFGGRMGLGSKYTAVPWVNVTKMLGRNRLLMDRAQLENAPLLPGRKPESGNTDWGREANDYWRAIVPVAADSSL